MIFRRRPRTMFGVGDAGWNITRPELGDLLKSPCAPDTK